MSAEVIQFLPRANPRSDRAFWIGPDKEAVEIANVALLGESEMVPAEPEYVAPNDDCA